MRLLFFLVFLVIACGPTSEKDEFASSSQEYNGNPPPPLVCKSNEMICYGKCIDISSDNRNCGWCEQRCDITVGEFCMMYQCKNVRDYGFSINPNGPREYDVRRDLPRPSPILEEEK